MAENIAETLDRPTDAARCTPGTVVRLMVTGLLVAALFGSTPLNGWAQRLAPSAIADRIQSATEAWDHAMVALGTAQWHGRVRAALQTLRERRFADPPD